jgi:hypothetical protein
MVIVLENEGVPSNPSFVPHLPQKKVSAGLSEWQSGQLTVLLSMASGYGEKITRRRA